MDTDVWNCCIKDSEVVLCPENLLKVVGLDASKRVQQSETTIATIIQARGF
jgi:hypothetical protein